MPNEIGGLLTQKIGPFPGWAWALGVGGLVFFLGPKLLSGAGSKSTTSGATPGGFDPQSFQAGWAQGVAYQPGGSNQPPMPQPGTLPPVQSGTYQPGATPAQDWQRRHGVGGASSGRSASVGSKSADPHAYFHPTIKAVPRFPHFARGGVGGASPSHQAAVHDVAHAAGIHPARLAALNPRPHRFIRVA